MTVIIIQIDDEDIINNSNQRFADFWYNDKNDNEMKSNNNVGNNINNMNNNSIMSNNIYKISNSNINTNTKKKAPKCQNKNFRHLLSMKNY